MKLQENQKENFINFWEFLEIPMNSPIGDIKVAFANKFEKIKNCIARGEDNYSPEDLKTCINAYETLSNPYSRFLHNCEIDGEEPPKDPDWDAYFSDDSIIDEDLSEESNQNFLAWLLSKANEYMSFAKGTCGNGINFINGLDIPIEFYKEVANRLYGLFIKEQEKQENKELLHQRNKKTMHN